MDMAFIMDPIESINPARDTTLALMLEAQRRGHTVYYVKPETLAARGDTPLCSARRVRVVEPPEGAKDMSGLFSADEPEDINLGKMDVAWMRKDPPFDMDYVYLTHILSLAEKRGAAVINRPDAIRKSNEKLSALEFARFMPDTLVSKDPERIEGFLAEKKKIVIKPLDGFGGEGVSMVETGADARRLIGEATGGGRVFVMAQEFIREVSGGDKRVIMLGGEPIGAVLRVPPEGGFICNFHSGGSPAKTEITERDREICGALGDYLRRAGIHLAGIDIVGGMLTEINCTSPTCVREINRFEGVRLESDIMDFAEDLARRTKK